MKYPRMRKFRLHFNRVNMQRGKPQVWTIHLSDRCVPAREVHVQVPVQTVFRPSGPQPRAWFEGYAVVIGITDQGPDVYGLVTGQHAFALQRAQEVKP
jgi:hypothetical protein